MKLPIYTLWPLTIIMAALASTVAKPVLAQNQHWVLKVKEAVCWGGSNATAACLADAYYYETSSLKAYHCLASSKGSNATSIARGRVDSIVCTRMYMLFIVTGTVNIEPASGQPEDRGQTYMPPGTNEKFAWADGFWVVWENRKALSFCVNTPTIPVAQVCGPLPVWN
jgi:hypothetical protein